MNQNDKIKLCEAKKELLEIISDSHGGRVDYFKQPDGPFNLNDLLNLIANVRINNKYQLLDLEATRREKDKLVKMLEDANHD